MAARRPGLVAKKIMVAGRLGKRHQRTYWVRPNVAANVRLRKAAAEGERVVAPGGADLQTVHPRAGLKAFFSSRGRNLSDQEINNLIGLFKRPDGKMVTGDDFNRLYANPGIKQFTLREPYSPRRYAPWGEEDFKNVMVNGAPKQVAFKVRLDIASLNVDSNTMGISVRVMGTPVFPAGHPRAGEPTGEGDVQMSSGTMDRSFTRSNGELSIYHAYFFMEARYQNSGLGGEVIKNQFKQYEEFGVNKVSVSAASMGRYFWPRLGFEQTPSGRENMHANLVNHLRRTQRGEGDIRDCSNPDGNYPKWGKLEKPLYGDPRNPTRVTGKRLYTVEELSAIYNPAGKSSQQMVSIAVPVVMPNGTVKDVQLLKDVQLSGGGSFSGNVKIGVGEKTYENVREYLKLRPPQGTPEGAAFDAAEQVRLREQAALKPLNEAQSLALLEPERRAALERQQREAAERQAREAAALAARQEAERVQRERAAIAQPILNPAGQPSAQDIRNLLNNRVNSTEWDAVQRLAPNARQAWVAQASPIQGAERQRAVNAMTGALSAERVVQGRELARRLRLAGMEADAAIVDSTVASHLSEGEQRARADVRRGNTGALDAFNAAVAAGDAALATRVAGQAQEIAALQTRQNQAAQTQQQQAAVAQTTQQVAATQEAERQRRLGAEPASAPRGSRNIAQFESTRAALLGQGDDAAREAWINSNASQRQRRREAYDEATGRAAMARADYATREAAILREQGLNREATNATNRARRYRQEAEARRTEWAQLTAARTPAPPPPVATSQAAPQTTAQASQRVNALQAAEREFQRARDVYMQTPSIDGMRVVANQRAMQEAEQRLNILRAQSQEIAIAPPRATVAANTAARDAARQPIPRLTEFDMSDAERQSTVADLRQRATLRMEDVREAMPGAQARLAAATAGQNGTPEQRRKYRAAEREMAMLKRREEALGRVLAIRDSDSLPMQASRAIKAMQDDEATREYVRGHEAIDRMKERFDITAVAAEAGRRAEAADRARNSIEIPRGASTAEHSAALDRQAIARREYQRLADIASNLHLLETYLQESPDSMVRSVEMTAVNRAAETERQIHEMLGRPMPAVPAVPAPVAQPQAAGPRPPTTATEIARATALRGLQDQARTMRAPLEAKLTALGAENQARYDAWQASIIGTGNPTARVEALRAAYQESQGRVNALQGRIASLQGLEAMPADQADGLGQRLVNARQRINSEIGDAAAATRRANEARAARVTATERVQTRARRELTNLNQEVNQLNERYAALQADVERDGGAANPRIFDRMAAITAERDRLAAKRAPLRDIVNNVNLHESDAAIEEATRTVNGKADATSTRQAAARQAIERMAPQAGAMIERQSAKISELQDRYEQARQTGTGDERLELLSAIDREQGIRQQLNRIASGQANEEDVANVGAIEDVILGKEVRNTERINRGARIIQQRLRGQAVARLNAQRAVTEDAKKEVDDALREAQAAQNENMYSPRTNAAMARWQEAIAKHNNAQDIEERMERVAENRETDRDRVEVDILERALTGKTSRAGQQAAEAAGLASRADENIALAASRLRRAEQNQRLMPGPESERAYNQAVTQAADAAVQREALRAIESGAPLTPEGYRAAQRILRDKQLSGAERLQVKRVVEQEEQRRDAAAAAERAAVEARFRVVLKQAKSQASSMLEAQTAEVERLRAVRDGMLDEDGYMPTGPMIAKVADVEESLAKAEALQTSMRRIARKELTPTDAAELESTAQAMAAKEGRIREREEARAKAEQEAAAAAEQARTRALQVQREAEEQEQQAEAPQTTGTPLERLAQVREGQPQYAQRAGRGRRSNLRVRL